MRMKFWLRTALKNSGTIVAATAIYGGVMLLLNVGDSPVESWIFYTTAYSGFMQLASGIGLLQNTSNLALSMGATRRETFWGIFIVALLPVLTMTAFSVLSYAALAMLGEKSPLTQWVIPMNLAVGLIGSEAGLTIGMLMKRFGKAAGIAAGIVLLLLAVSIGFCTGLGVFAALPGIWAGAETIWWIFTLVGLAIYAGLLIPVRRVVSRFTVKI